MRIRKVLPALAALLLLLGIAAVVFVSASLGGMELPALNGESAAGFEAGHAAGVVLVLCVTALTAAGAVSLRGQRG